MKTPEEIKKGLEICFLKHNPELSCAGCPYGDMRVCGNDLGVDILAYILQLERERDAAIRDIQHVCKRCIHSEHRFLADGKLDDRCGTCVYNGMCNWQWRGVQEVE